MADAAAAPPEVDVAAKVEWVKQMRLQFSPKGLCNAEGEIVQDFFKPKKILIQLTEDKKWGPAEREALYKGLEEHGVGKWREMITQHPELRRYDDQFVRLKAGRLLGTQSLARHVGWRGGRAAVDAERERHRAIGERLGCWKAGVLVEDDHGSVAAALREAAAEAAAAEGAAA